MGCPIVADDLTIKQVRQAKALLSALPQRPDLMVASREWWVAYVRATVDDPYERLKLLFNAGCRGADLR